MSEPTIAAKQPVCVELEAGKTCAWCGCGLSKSQPLCDGSDRGTGPAPRPAIRAGDRGVE